MRILITGSSGLVGAFVVDRLKGEHEVTTLDLRPSLTPDLPHHQTDVLRLDDLRRAVKGFDAVVHLAGIPHPLNDPPELVYRVNTIGTFHMLQACVESQVRKFVFMSSESTLGFAFSKTRLWPLALPITESHPLRPQDSYGLSKLACEAACRGASEASGMKTICLRAPWIWVPKPEEVRFYQQLIDDFPKWYKNLWAYIHVDDVAEAIRLSLSADIVNHDAMFICATENWTGHTTKDLVREFFPESAAWSDGCPGASSLISPRRASEILGFSPQRTSRDLGLHNG